MDFRKKLRSPVVSKPTEPSAIYASLDRSSEKGPLRPAQASLLEEWHNARRSERDLVLKLHTGQGKTLVGLLILQSKLNEGAGPALYVCPNNFLVEQTCLEAAAFGLSVTRMSDEIPESFANSRSILVASVQSVFNGRSKFGLDSYSQEVGAIVLDDAHACMDVMQSQNSIHLRSDSPAYAEILTLFESGLKEQGVGTFADLKRHEYEALLPVPYWEWIDKVEDVATILSRHSEAKSIRFAWPLLRDALENCQCVITGQSLAIAPHLPPLHRFGSFVNAGHRVCMSATITDDSFLVKGLRFPAASIRKPLAYGNEKWSGEKMILVPSLIAEDLDRAAIIARFAKPKSGRNFGVVALCPSFKRADEWRAAGAIAADTRSIASLVGDLKTGNAEKTMAFANRYDGIDLPDRSCRILILDSKPFSESPIERYFERCVGSGETIAARTARIVEQGLGRSVRGEKDYCAILLIGPDLIRQIRTPASRRYFSAQTRAQIEIGLEIAADAKAEQRTPMEALIALVNQSLRRDEGWKEFYTERMDAVDFSPSVFSRLEVFEYELMAEKRAEQGLFDEAVAQLQTLSDRFATSDAEKGWYLQEMARLKYRSSKAQSNKLQIAAHKRNRFLLKPRDGMVVQRISQLSQRRVDAIIDTIKGLETYEALSLAVDEVAFRLNFGVESERFEGAIDRLGKLLGFACERPDAEWKEGPDNLWCLRDNDYLLFECKSEVAATRAEISKYESEQINSSAAWFQKNYPGCRSRNLLVHPAKRLQGSAAFLQPVQVMRLRQLEALTRNVRAFFGEFKAVDFSDIAPDRVQEFLSTHSLSTDDFLTKYGEDIRA